MGCAGTAGASDFGPQQILDGFIADFYCHSAALVVEVDGLLHDPEYDAERDRVFAARGILVLHFTNDEVREQSFRPGPVTHPPQR